MSGSLRSGASSSAVLRAVRLLAPPDVDVVLYDGLAALPAFNPDDDQPGLPLPPTASALRARVSEADALLICSPEYAHGIPGSLKNLLDWLVGSTDVTGKPVTLIAASPRSVFVRAQPTEVLRTIAVRLVPDEAVVMPVVHHGEDAAAIAADPHRAIILRSALEGLRRSLR